jgi:hypothetical protein
LVWPHSTDTAVRRLAVNKLVVQPLMIPLAMVVGDELRDRSSMMALAERNQRFRHSSLIERANRSAYALALSAR